MGSKYGHISVDIVAVIRANPEITNTAVAKQIGCTSAYVSKVRNERGLGKFRYKPKPNSIQSQVRRVLEQDQFATTAEVREQVQCSASHVSHVRRLMGITSLQYCKHMLMKENLAFLSAEMKAHNLTASELLDAIVTDARMENQ